MELTDVQGRVLGCLVEKQLTTPQQYPLTESALLAACNQTTSRDPVVSYDTATVRLAVRSLREQGLLRTVHRTGERSDKHQHQLDSALGLSPAQTALLAVLLLRGPQTLAELRARTERMHAFDGVDAVEEALAPLAARDDPLVRRLDRQPGRKEARYAQLLVEPGPAPSGGAHASQPADPPVLRPFPGTPPAAVPEPAADPAPGDHASAPADHASAPADLVAEVALLRAEVAALRARLDALAPPD